MSQPKKRIRHFIFIVFSVPFNLSIFLFYFLLLTQYFFIHFQVIFLQLVATYLKLFIFFFLYRTYLTCWTFFWCGRSFSSGLITLNIFVRIFVGNIIFFLSFFVEFWLDSVKKIWYDYHRNVTQGPYACFEENNFFEKKYLYSSSRKQKRETEVDSMKMNVFFIQ